MVTIERKSPKVSRRGFLGGSAGLSFAVALGASGFTLLPEARASTGQIGAWVRIRPDNTITIITPAAEMGQGSMTGVPVALAEEMDADWATVALEMAPADPDTYGYVSFGGRKSMGIYGSFAVMRYFDQMRLAGSQVRRVLLDAAAEKWGVAVAELTTEPNTVVHAVSGRRLSYGEIAGFAKVPAAMPSVSEADLKPRNAFSIIGKPVPRADIPAKVNGTAQYAIDVHVPGMVYASTVHGPVQGTKPQGWNDADIRALPGVSDVVKLDNGVAVVADTFEHVIAARNALEVSWSEDAAAQAYDSETALFETYPAMLRNGGKGSPVNRTGDPDAAFANAARTFRAEYRSDYGYHAQMEPLNAVARYDASAGTVEIWEGTQAPGSSRAAIASALGLGFDKVIHHQQYMGGAFGRRSVTDYTIEAAQVSRATGKPVKMIWTREEDLANGMFRPQTLQCAEAALDASGKVTAWRQCVVGDGGGLITSGMKLERYYGITSLDLEQRGASHAIRLKHWRAVAHPFNLFAIEGLVDEMAAAVGQDPIAFRREHLSLTPRARDVFDRVEAMSNWREKRPEGRALGVAVSERSGSLGAGVVEISLNREIGKIRVHKVWVAVDGGTVVQPDMARANIESGVVYGLSSVLKERATVTGGAVDQSNFHDYEVLRMSESPEEIHVDFIDRDTKPTGLGEIGNPFIAGAVANAFYALTGKRLYHMPFTPERVLEVLKA
jgi:isoquinoline 1-oxidoreductase beta subunit